MKNGVITELCAGSLSDCMTAVRFPEIDRIELNCALELDGLTPSFNTFTAARKMTDKKIICMVRPRTAGFVYTEAEKKVMFDDASMFLENGADGIVFGFLEKDLSIDIQSVRQMCSLVHSFGKEAVFHMAFDMTPDSFKAAESLIRCGADRILTRGHADSALMGIDNITALNRKYGSFIQFLPGGGVNSSNVCRILRQTEVRQIHFSAKSKYFDNGDYSASDPDKIKNIFNALDNL